MSPSAPISNKRWRHYSVSLGTVAVYAFTKGYCHCDCRKVLILEIKRKVENWNKLSFCKECQ